MTTEVMVKGQAFHSVFSALEELRGTSFREQVERAYAGEAGDALRSGALLPSSWCPVSWYRELFATALRQAPFALALPREVGLASGRREVRGLYRVMFRMLATETLVKQAPRFFRVFYQGGQAEVTDSGQNFGIVKYSECYGFDAAIWQDLLGGAEAAFEATGAVALRLRVETGGSDGDDGMVVSVRWNG